MSLTIDCNFPGGNIILERIEGDNVYLHQDIRDTEGDWFYWYFRIQGASGRTLRFHFTKSNVIGTRGPGVSENGGQTWYWLGADRVQNQSFEFTFNKDAKDIRFSFGMPYLQDKLDLFLENYKNHPHLKIESLCQSKKGRHVELLRLGSLNTPATHRIIITARHHCCEMMQSYVLEGVMAAILADNALGQWFQSETQCIIIPFVDKDGVEEGDQGKNRKPRDHNRDYNNESLYTETQAIREHIPKWQPTVALDFHCPYIRGKTNEMIYQVGLESETLWKEQCRFSTFLEQTSTFPYQASDNMPFGQGWNTQNNYGAGKSFARWAGELSSTQLVSSIEFPYANVKTQDITPENARAFGKDFAQALKAYLETE
ncbi:MAG: peptidase M14 [Candidatus Latescibacterota bacterium]